MSVRAGQRNTGSMDDDDPEEEFLPYQAIPVLGRIALGAAVIIAIARALFS